MRGAQEALGEERLSTEKEACPPRPTLGEDAAPALWKQKHRPLMAVKWDEDNSFFL